MHPHRIDILDAANDYAVVVAVAHDFHLIFFPAEQRFFDQHFGRRAGVEPAGHDPDKFLAVIGDPAAGPAHRERWPDDRRQPRPLEHGQRLIKRMRNPRARAFQPDLGHRIAEFDPVLGLVDRLGIRANHLDAIFRERPIVEQRQRGIQRRLPAHRRQDRIGPFLLDDLRHDFGRNRLDISRIGQLRIGHDRRRIAVDQHDPIALRLQRLHGLRPRIIKFTRLPDDDRPCADDQD